MIMCKSHPPTSHLRGDHCRVLQPRLRDPQTEKVDITIIVDGDNKDDENEDNHGVNDDENEDDGDDDVGMCENDYDDSDGDGNDVHLGHHLCVAVDQVVAVQGGGQLHLDDDDDDDGDDENDGYDKQFQNDLSSFE